MENILDVEFDVESLSVDELVKVRKEVVKKLYTLEKEILMAKDLNLDLKNFTKRKKALSKMLFLISVKLRLNGSC